MQQSVRDTWTGPSRTKELALNRYSEEALQEWDEPECEADQKTGK